MGWTGVGWVASGIYIKMNRSFDPPKKPSGARSAGLLEKDVRDAGELESLAAGQDGELHILTPKFTTPQTVASRSRTCKFRPRFPAPPRLDLTIFFLRSLPICYPCRRPRRCRHSLLPTVGSSIRDDLQPSSARRDLRPRDPRCHCARVSSQLHDGPLHDWNQENWVRHRAEEWE